MHMNRIESRFYLYELAWRVCFIRTGTKAKISHNYALLMKKREI